VAASLTARPPAEVEVLISAYFAEMPDEPLFENIKTFLKATDRSFFNRNAFSSEIAVLIRTLTGNLLQSTRGWKCLQKDRTDSVDTHIADVVSTYYFNDGGNFLMPSKCYLLPAAIPMVTPFLKPLLTLALDCHSPRIGAVASI
jgi:hypothetical protein